MARTKTTARKDRRPLPFTPLNIIRSKKNPPTMAVKKVIATDLVQLHCVKSENIRRVLKDYYPLQISQGYVGKLQAMKSIDNIDSNA